jgi:hypothetical protein
MGLSGGVYHHRDLARWWRPANITVTLTPRMPAAVDTMGHLKQEGSEGWKNRGKEGHCYFYLLKTKKGSSKRSDARDPASYCTGNTRQ